MADETGHCPTVLEADRALRAEQTGSQEPSKAGEQGTSRCCRFSPWSGRPMSADAEACPCGHLITPGYRCHECGSTRSDRAAPAGGRGATGGR